MRLQRWAIILSPFNYSIKSFPSKQNAVADALSRLPLPSTPNDEDSAHNVEERLIQSLRITHKEIRKCHESRPSTLEGVRINYVAHGWPKHVKDLPIQPYFNRRFDLSVLEQDCLLWGLRVVIPTRYQEDMLQELQSSHPGIVPMKEMARSYLWWPNIDQEVEQTVKNCESFQQVKKPPALTPLTPWLWPIE